MRGFLFSLSSSLAPEAPEGCSLESARLYSPEWRRTDLDEPFDPFLFVFHQQCYSCILHRWLLTDAQSRMHLLDYNLPHIVLRIHRITSASMDPSTPTPPSHSTTPKQPHQSRTSIHSHTIHPFKQPSPTNYPVPMWRYPFPAPPRASRQTRPSYSTENSRLLSRLGLSLVEGSEQKKGG